MAIPPVLRSLLTATGPSGYETAPAAVFREAAGAFAEVSGDVMGSSWARVKGTGGGPTMAIVGHIDEIGLIVTHIDDDGFLRFTGVGGWDTQILVGQRVELATRGGVVPGVIGKKPIHLLKDDERKKVAEIKELHIDVGARDADEARALVRVGDVTHATDAPGIDVNELGSHAFGSGPVIERGSNLHPAVLELLREAGEAERIPFTVAASARHTGTDVDAMHLSRGGVPCGLVGLPLRYMHSPVEMVDLDDIDAAARLIAAAARRLAADAAFGR